MAHITADDYVVKHHVLFDVLVEMKKLGSFIDADVMNLLHNHPEPVPVGVGYIAAELLLERERRAENIKYNRRVRRWEWIAA